MILHSPMNTSALYVFGFFVAIIVIGLGLSYLVKRRGGNAGGPKRREDRPPQDDGRG